MKTVKIAGVPEHFNQPWHVAIDNKQFENENIALEWTDVPEGTGKLCQMLRNNETDIAVILTEGIIKDITLGNPSKIVQIYVKSPLIWGIHVSADSNYHNIEELENKTAAISRIGSGSQLMTYVNADLLNWDKSKLNFEIIHTIDGAVTALQNKEADYFMWEKFMTKPLVDQGVFRNIADCPTPWPCFVIAVTDEFLKNNDGSLPTILNIINKTTKQFKEQPKIIESLSKKFNQKESDLTEWLNLTHWSQENLNPEMLNNIQNQLLNLSIINKKGTFTEIVHE